MEKPIKYCEYCKKETPHFIWNETDEEVCEECFVHEQERAESYYDYEDERELEL